MAKGRFGGDVYKPKQLGPEPASPVIVDVPPSASPKPDLGPSPLPDNPEVLAAAALKAVKVPFSSRISYAADMQLKDMAKQGRSQTELLAEALNLLFKKHRRDEVA